MTYDVLIVGSGSAGCVLAARLSEDRRRSVLLLEAGPDYRSQGELPPEIRAGFNPTSSHDWGFVSEPADGIPPIPLLRGKLIGGCSSTNGVIALRGTPADYDEWAALGNAGWSFDEVLPFFRRLEHDHDCDGDHHGRGGPLPIRRYAPDELPGCQVMLTMKSGDDCVTHDLHIFPWTITQANPGDSPTGGWMTIHVSLMKPRSRGRLQIRTADPTVPPLIETGFFTHADDMPRMLVAVQMARQLAQTAPLSQVALEELAPGRAIGDGAALERAVRSGLKTYFHPVGTCGMGPAADPLAVVDSRGAVHGVEHLSVVDASIMPTIPAANTNVPTIMIAERCADWLAESI